MMRIYFVDDEPLALIGMQGILDWPALGFEVAGAARNGADALRDIEILEPDVVITDIMMPVMDGLELAEACRERDAILPVFIMLTSYEELEYIKRSMRIGAVEYLNKMELTAQTLQDALERAKRIIEKERALREASRTPQPDRLNTERERLFLQLCSGLFTEREAFDRATARLGMRFDAQAYAVALAALNGDDTDDGWPDTRSQDARRMVSETLPRLLRCWVMDVDPLHFCALIPMESADAREELLTPALRKASDIISRYFNLGLRWVVGPAVRDILQVNRSRQAAADALPRLNKLENILYCDVNVTAEQGRAGKQLVSKAQEYIRRNLDKRLSLNDVAEVFHFSPNYLSQLFAESGAGFVEFVTSERLNCAKELMASTELKVYEISERVGFASAFYFSKVFKKAEGVSPRDYMKMVREQRESK